MTAFDKSNIFITWIKTILIATILTIILNIFVISSSTVDGISMEPTLNNNDKVIFNKFIYIISEPSRGDIVIIKQRDNKYIKRIIALPGETIEMKSHELFINGKKQHTTFVSQSSNIFTENFGPWKVPEEQYFVMGDNRINSKDSRNGLGHIKRNEIVGRSEFIIYPFDRLSKIK